MNPRALTGGRTAVPVLVLAFALMGLDGMHAVRPLEAQQVMVLAQRDGSPGWLGVQYDVLRSFAAGSRASGRTDYVVSDVHPEGPAAAAGIRPGDVLLRIRGAEPGDTLFERIAETLRSGDTVQLTFRRGSSERELPLVAVDRPPDERVGLLPGAELADVQRFLRFNDGGGEQGGTTIVFRSGTGQGFSYRIVAPAPGTPFPFESFVVRTPATDSLTALINLIRRDLAGIERASEAARVAVLRSTAATVDERATELAGLQERRSLAFAQLTRLQDDLAVVSRQRLGSLGRRLGDIRVRVSPQAALTPLVRMERRYLVGAEIIPIDAELGTYFGVERGILVAASPQGTPAAAAGLTPGDVIVRVGDTEVTTPIELSRALREVRGAIVLTVVRRGSEVTVQLR